MATSTVKLNGTTLLTVNDTTAVAGDVAQGKIFTAVDGSKVSGTATGGGGGAISIVDTPDAAGGTVRTITAVDISSDTVTAAHLESGYTAHDAAGNAITGTLSPGGGSGLSWQTEFDSDVYVESTSSNYFYVQNYNVPFTANQAYKVTVDGTPYIMATTVDTSGTTAVDGYILGQANFSSYPVLLYRNSSYALIGATTLTAGTHNVKIELLIES